MTAFAPSAPRLASLLATLALPVACGTEAALEVLEPGDEDQSLVSTDSMNGKMMMGYQGWFGCPGDGSRVNNWVHWFQGRASPSTPTVDLWPEMSELDADERCNTGFTKPDGSAAPLYSAYRQKTVVRHFKWMQDYGIDGVLLQRFTGELGNAALFDFRNKVAANVRAGAEAHGRVFALMYDVSGASESSLVDVVKRDWAYMVNTLRITESSRYLRHNGKPVLAIWGLGFNDRVGTPDQARAIIDHFQRSAPGAEQVTLLGGVPLHWRSLGGASKTDPAWAAIYRSFDIISPWAVGAFGDDAGADSYKRTISADLAEARNNGRDYMPVIFPGFSWHNLMRVRGEDSPYNLIPRRGGRFYWRQAYNAIAAGSKMLFGAMFDEVDEGTAMLKVAATTAATPVQASFLPLDVDGEAVPSDWYLRLAGEATKMLRGERPLGSSLPSTPPPGDNPQPPVTPTGANAALFVSQVVPASVSPGQRFTVRISMRNTGSATWSLAARYYLGSENPRDNMTWGTNRIAFPAAASVPSGATTELSATLTAPAAAGTYNFQWQMLQDAVAWFGAKSTNVAIVVGSGQTPGTPQPPTASAASIKVTHGYRGILGREPDAGGLASYTDAITNGMTMETFCQTLFSSPEYAEQRSQLTAEQLAKELYRGILGREADPGGLASTIDAINAGNRVERAADMLKSAEFAQKFL
ncbi:MAG: DUF4214 domain-containing protein [Deltaproteobacteria bacterium]|nr:DUF4214 domain-containing protein [Deltaproteobacteria bacterium]